MIRRFFASARGQAGAAAPQSPESPAPPEHTRENLMVVVRESPGANRQEESFRATPKAWTRLADGREVEIDVAWWDYLADTHIRFVFDAPTMMMSASPQDLASLGVQRIEDALALAIANIRRVYGEPGSYPFSGGVMQVKGRSPDLDSSYFLDRAFWWDRLEAHPEGLVVAVVKRGGLLYTPAASTADVEGLQRGVAYLHESSGQFRVSSALFLFKDGRWSVFQAPTAGEVVRH